MVQMTHTKSFFLTSPRVQLLCGYICGMVCVCVLHYTLLYTGKLPLTEMLKSCTAGFLPIQMHGKIE